MTEAATTWGRATLKVYGANLSRSEFEQALKGLGLASGEVTVKKTRHGPLWRDRCSFPATATAQSLWEWAIAEVEAVLGVLGGPPPGCTAELWLGLDVPSQRGLWCSSEEICALGAKGVDLVLDLHA